MIPEAASSTADTAISPSAAEQPFQLNSNNDHFHHLHNNREMNNPRLNIFRAEYSIQDSFRLVVCFRSVVNLSTQATQSNQPLSMLPIIVALEGMVWMVLFLHLVGEKLSILIVTRSL